VLRGLLIDLIERNLGNAALLQLKRNEKLQMKNKNETSLAHLAVALVKKKSFYYTPKGMDY